MVNTCQTREVVSVSDTTSDCASTVPGLPPDTACSETRACSDTGYVVAGPLSMTATRLTAVADGPVVKKIAFASLLSNVVPPVR